MFDESFIDGLPDDGVEALRIMCDKYFEFHQRIPSGTEEGQYNNYIRGYATILKLSEVLAIPADPSSLTGDKGEDINMMLKSVKILSKLVVQHYSDQIIAKESEGVILRWEASFNYEFSEGDFSLVQKLLNELRDIIVGSELFDAKHKDRILKKMEALQRELHKKMSNLDKFWGLIGEAGVTLGKFGRDAKPIVDRVREIAQIVWRTQARAEELPSGFSLPFFKDGEIGQE